MSGSRGVMINSIHTVTEPAFESEDKYLARIKYSRSHASCGAVIANKTKELLSLPNSFRDLVRAPNTSNVMVQPRRVMQGIWRRADVEKTHLGYRETVKRFASFCRSFFFFFIG